MQENKLEPVIPESDSPVSDIGAAAESSPHSNQWRPRPIAVYIIAAWCVLQYLGILMFVASNWASFSELMRIGVEPPIVFFGKLIYPTVLLAGGILLFLMRKAALTVFAVYFVWGVTKVFTQHIAFPGYLSLALVLGIVVYCFRLKQEGRLN